MSCRYGLVMEGGAMRGMFTAGILDVFMEHHITFDGAIGVSAGATFGCNFKSHQMGRAIRYNIRFAGDRRYCSLWSLMTTGDLYGADFCYNKLPNKIDIFDFDSFRANPMPFYVVASDCETGLPVYKELKTCDSKDMLWMRASASMPMVSRPVEIDEKFYLDGGITDSIPLKHFQDSGYEKNLVILTQHREYQKETGKSAGMMKLWLRKFPAIAEAMEKRAEMYNAQKKYVFEEEAKGNTFVIHPHEPLGISRTESNTDELQRVYNEGRNIAKEKLQDILAFLGQEE